MRQSVRDVKGQPGYALEEKAVISGTAVVASVAIPLVIYLGLLWGRYAISLRTHDGSTCCCC